MKYSVAYMMAAYFVGSILGHLYVFLKNHYKGVIILMLGLGVKEHDLGLDFIQKLLQLLQ